MAVKIKLKRMGKTRNPQYRIVIADSRTARGGRAIEEIGIYQPRQEPSLIQVNSERAQYWLTVGAQPTEPVMAILKVTGDWQKFKGLPGAEGTLRVAEPKANKQMVFEAAVKSAEEAGRSPKPKAPKPQVDVAPVAEVVVEAPVVQAAVVEAPVVQAPVTDVAPVEDVVAEVPVAPVAEPAAPDADVEGAAALDVAPEETTSA